MTPSKVTVSDQPNVLGSKGHGLIHLVEVVSTGSSVKDLKEAIEKARQIPTPLGSRQNGNVLKKPGSVSDVVDCGTTWEVVV